MQSAPRHTSYLQRVRNLDDSGMSSDDLSNGPGTTTSSSSSSSSRRSSSSGSRTDTEGPGSNGGRRRLLLLDTGFPIDSCEATVNAESTFVDANRFEQYTTNGGNSSGCSTPDAATKTVLYSRALGKRFVTTNALTSDALHTFRSCGHTLAVDNVRSYARMCAFDLDCVCRSSGGRGQHLGEQTATAIVECLRKLLREITRTAVTCVLWRRACGFHLYTDVPVSMPLHLELGARLNAAFSAREVVIEVPTHMPLPYSAKTAGDTYRPMLINQVAVPLLCTGRYYDRYVLRPQTIEQEEDTVVARLQTRFGVSLLLVATKTATTGLAAPRYAHVVRIDFTDSSFDYLEPLRNYIEHVWRRREPDDGAPTVQRDDDATDRRLPVVDDDDDTSALLTSEKFKRFMNKFNSSHFAAAAADDDDCGRFVRVSAVENGALYMQHYAVALYKCMSPITDEEFKRLLALVYETDADPRVARLTDRFSVHTANGYNDNYEAMLDFLSLTYMHQLSVSDTLETHINRMMCDRLGVQSLAAWSAQYRNSRGTDKDVKRCQALEAYVQIMSRMKYLVHYNQVWYVYTNEACHKSTDLGSVPCINAWVNLDNVAKRYIDTEVSAFTVRDMWSTCEFMFATSVGVFNSLTGMYAAKVPLLRFVKSRHCSVWDLERPLTMYTDQNTDVLALGRAAKRFADTVCDRTTELFLHYQVIPAMLQLPQVYNVDDKHMSRFFELFESHGDIASARFLVEYYPVEPTFVYVCMYLYSKYGLETLVDYNRLVRRVFEFRTSVPDWAGLLGPRLARVSYDKTAPDHMAKLMSLRDDGGSLDWEITESFCIYCVMISVVMVKCFSYRPLLRACGVHELPACVDRSLIPEVYRDADYRTTLECYRRITEQTLRTVYGDGLTEFETALARMTLQICMSVCFDPDTARELVNMVSAIYVPRNILKKMLLLTGPQNTGKSFFCDLIANLNDPSVGRFQDIRQAVERANITTKTNVTIINEASTVNPHHMKSVTGNDGESAQVFYSQLYEMQKFQSLVYGATNGVIVFKDSDKKRFNVDRTTVDRIHAITLNGVQVYESDEKNDSLFTMVAMSRFFAGVMNVKEDVSARALGWLAYTNYYHRKDANHKPRLDTSNRDVLAYQQLVYYKNNALYAFLVQSGIVEESGFYIDSRSVVEAARRSIAEKVHSKTFATFGDFEKEFNLHYGVKIQDTRIVHGLQFSMFVDHVKTFMETVRCEGHDVVETDLETRIEVYGKDVLRSNAREYFKRKNNAAYDHATRSFRNVKFVQDTAECYVGNEIGDDRDAAATTLLLYPKTFVTESV